MNKVDPFNPYKTITRGDFVTAGDGPVFLTVLDEDAVAEMKQRAHSCDYCGERHPILMDVGMGALMCERCRVLSDAATRSGLHTFEQLADFARLSSCSGEATSASVTVAPSPFHGFRVDTKKTPWWDLEAFWRDGLHAAGIWMLFWTFSPQDVVEIWRWARAEKTAHCPHCKEGQERRRLR